MKTYVLISGLVFLLVVAAHVARIAAEGPHLLQQPTFVVTSLLSVGLTAWDKSFSDWYSAGRAKKARPPETHEY